MSRKEPGTAPEYLTKQLLRPAYGEVLLLCRTSVLFLLIILELGCATHLLKPMTASTPKTPWDLTYHDGSGNGLRFWRVSVGDPVRFTYTPVTPEMSSSGLYDGGKAQHGDVNDAQAEELWHWVQRLEADTTLHAPSRMMKTGAFRLTTPDDARAFLIKDSAILRAFNEFLLGVRDD